MNDLENRDEDNYRNDVKGLSIKFLDYLSAVAREVTTKPQRDCHCEQESLFLDECVTANSYILWGPSDSRSAWLTVKKVGKPSPPRVPDELSQYIDVNSIVSDESTPALDPFALDRKRTAINRAISSRAVDSSENGTATRNDDRMVGASEVAEIAQNENADSEQMALIAAQGKDYAVFLEDMQRQLDEWTEAVWSSWCQENAHIFEARRLYNKLYDLHAHYSSMMDSQELVWGNAIFYYDTEIVSAGSSPKSEKIHVCYPAVTTGMTMQVDGTTGALTVLPDSTTTLNTTVVDGLDLRGVEGLTLLHDEVERSDDDIDVWDDDARFALERRIVAPLGVDAQVVDRNHVPKRCANPVVTDEFVLILRNRPKREQQFYTDLSKEIKGDDFLPEALDSLIIDNDTIEKTHDVDGQGHPSDSPSIVSTLNDDAEDRIWMPLPSNEEQRRIASEIAHNSGVTVQGPPGTGKTHTIANLVSHLLAHGQRVLVTAEKDQALNVLRDKIPAQIRDLTMAVTGSTPASIEKLKDSAQSMQNRLSSVNPIADSAKVHDLQRRIDDLEDEAHLCDVQLGKALAVEQSEFTLPMGSLRAGDVAKWVEDNSNIDLIPDDIDKGVSFPLSVEDFREFVDLCRAVSPEEAAASAFDHALADGLPGGEEMSRLFSDAAALRESVTSLDDGGLILDAVDGLTSEQIDGLVEGIHVVLRHGEKIDGELYNLLFSPGRYSAEELDWLRTQNRRVMDDSRLGVDLKQPLLGHDVLVPDGSRTSQQSLISEWRIRASSGKKIGIFASKSLKEFSHAVTVDGSEPESVEQLDIVDSFIRVQALWSQTARFARDIYSRYQVTTPSVEDPEDFLALRHCALAIEDVFEWCNDEREPLDRQLATLVTFPHPAYSRESLRRSEDLLRRTSDRRKQKDVEQRISAVQAVCDQAISSDSGNPLWNEFKQALVARDAGRWNSAYHRFQKLLRIHKCCIRRDVLGKHIDEAGAVLWKERLVSSCGDTRVYGSLGTLESSWEIAQAKTWLRNLHKGPGLESLMKRSGDVAKELSQTTVELIRLASLVHLKANTRDSERRALAGWLQAIKKIGKGTGKNAPRFRAQAQRLLPEALGAVPVWIMPIYRVLENFVPGKSRPFDVVIVDESSQCDLLTVGVLALARKAIIVGDDKQTSPNRVGIDTSRIFDLQNQYLKGIPDKTLLSVDTSLYALADRAFKNTILLREHYRCVPEIIEYSNRYYNGQIKPLRECTRPQIGSPLRAVHVENGLSRKQGSSRINDVEAERIADLLSRCVKDPNYDGMTFGVVSMMSGKQSDVIYTAIKNKVDSAQIEGRRIRVGNPPDFQGDERDVIILSMVADDHSFAATSESYMQWANVAVSRARDQLWVFYSMDYLDLNANDVRRGIIDYAENFHYEQGSSDLFALTESKFEEDVLRDMLRHGYNVEPQHKVGRYRIDFVITVAPGFRFAVECDGDSYHGSDQLADDIRRQRDLERLGWNFWRIRASQYYLDRESSMRPLWDRLEDMRQRARGTTTYKPDLPTMEGSLPQMAEDEVVSAPRGRHRQIP